MNINSAQSSCSVYCWHSVRFPDNFQTLIIITNIDSPFTYKMALPAKWLTPTFFLFISLFPFLIHFFLFEFIFFNHFILFFFLNMFFFLYVDWRKTFSVFHLLSFKNTLFVRQIGIFEMILVICFCLFACLFVCLFVVVFFLIANQLS